jgi:hypothetical protein
MVGLIQLTTRSQLIDANMTVQLTATFTDQFGTPTDTDSMPTVSIMTPTGLVSLTPTSAGVMKLSTGKYQFDFTVPFNGPYGVWNDIWQATINGFPVNSSFQFIVVNSDVQRNVNSDGYESIGDDPGFNYSQIAIRNINKLLKTLRARLNSRGKSKMTDANGNVIYVDCDIFSVEQLTVFIASALTDFNEVPYFTFFTFEDTLIIDQFHNVLVDGATLTALASQALIERGNEIVLNDSSISYTPPSISELMNTQYSTLLTNYYDKLKYIKASMRPNAISLGTYNVMAGRNPAIAKLRHMRSRRIL